MAVQIQRTTVEEFERFAALPENADRLFEYIGGEMVEVVSNQRSSTLAARISGFIFLYLTQNNIGFLTSSDGGYMIEGERYIPDVAFVSKARQPAPSDQAYSPIPPDLAVEVLSLSNVPRVMRLKIASFMAVGTTVWVVDPDPKSVEIYTPGQIAKTVGINDTLEGGDLLPGFSLSVKDIFEA
jgi:Uma2 family endonuclease